jgi:HEAT repeat protein
LIGVPIRASSRPEIDGLLADLSSPSPVARETAIARLTVIGTRAVQRLAAIVRSDTPPAARIAALRVLEGISSPQALDPVLAGVDERSSEVALAAVSASAAFLNGARSADVVDRLTRVALDSARHEDVRLAAIGALSGLKSTTLKPLWKALAQDASPTVRAHANEASRRRSTTPRRDPARDLRAASEGSLPDDPGALRHTIAETGPSLPLPGLHRLLERVREREASEPDAQRVGWTQVRAAVHVALAQRGSRLALYDLRESLESAAAPLPVEFLAALSLVGDVSCLEAIAAAYAKSPGQDPSRRDWWREHLVGSFQAIVKREGVTRRHAAMKRIIRRWPAAARELVG